MSDPIDTSIAASIGAAVVGAAVAVKEVFSKRKRKDPEDDQPLAARVGRLTDRVMQVEQEIRTMKQEFAQKLDKIEESVDELCIARAKTDELLPILREQLRDIKEDLRDRRPPSKE